MIKTLSRLLQGSNGNPGLVTRVDRAERAIDSMTKIKVWMFTSAWALVSGILIGVGVSYFVGKG